MYPDSRYKLAHAQSVCTRPFSPRREGPGDEAKVYQTRPPSCEGAGTQTTLKPVFNIATGCYNFTGCR